VRGPGEWFAVEGSLSLHRGFGEQSQEELMWFFALSASGFKQAALGLVVSGRNVRMAKAGEQELLLWSQ